MDKQVFNESLKIVKLVTSSLFARKQPYMIINGHTPETFYYTNIDRERIALYKATLDDVISKVTIKDPKVTNALYEAFPTLKNIIAQINLVKLSTAMNRAFKVVKGEFPKLKITDRLITMIIPPDPNKEGDKESELPVGELLSEFDPEFYDDVVKNYSKFSELTTHRRFRVNSVNNDDKVSLEIVEVSGKDDGTDYPEASFALPIKDGVTMVSAKEYVSRRSLDPVYDILLQVNPKSKTSKASIFYSDDWLDAMTILPGSLWFMTCL